MPPEILSTLALFSILKHGEDTPVQSDCSKVPPVILVIFVFSSLTLKTTRVPL